MKYVYDKYHAEVQNSHRYLSDEEIKEKALNSPNGSEEYVSDEPLSETECVEIYRFKGFSGLYVTNCSYYVLRED